MVGGDALALYGDAARIGRTDTPASLSNTLSNEDALKRSQGAGQPIAHARFNLVAYWHHD